MNAQIRRFSPSRYIYFWKKYETVETVTTRYRWCAYRIQYTQTTEDIITNQQGGGEHLSGSSYQGMISFDDGHFNLIESYFSTSAYPVADESDGTWTLNERSRYHYPEDARQYSSGFYFISDNANAGFVVYSNSTRVTGAEGLITGKYLYSISLSTVSSGSNPLYALCNVNKTWFEAGPGSLLNNNILDTNRNRYPDSGIMGSYWYEFQETITDTSYSRGTYIEDIAGNSESAYPANGRHTDGYWYVRIT